MTFESGLQGIGDNLMQLFDNSTFYYNIKTVVNFYFY
jgi:hypothetical protein